jgi:hypothetical protein
MVSLTAFYAACALSTFVRLIRRPTLHGIRTLRGCSGFITTASHGDMPKNSASKSHGDIVTKPPCRVRPTRIRRDRHRKQVGVPPLGGHFDDPIATGAAETPVPVGVVDTAGQFDTP